MTPRATYRIQLHKDFDFDRAAALAPYLARLGVSHLYASPYLKAHPGSTHGYDIVDHEKLNPELGGEDGFARLVAALQGVGLRQILDFVPNHMGVGGADNAIWLDLLEWGKEADHAGWFDVDFKNDRADLQDKVLVPMLGDQYGAVLEDGQLQLKFDAEEGSFAVWAYDSHKLPICPLDYGIVLGNRDAALEVLGDAFLDVTRWRPQIMRRARDLKAELRDLVVQNTSAREAVAAAVARFNGTPGDPASWDRLDALIQRQNWKATQFLVASDDINYRRFFNIQTLAGIRMELPDVFDGTHRLVIKLMNEGVLDGLRIDHIDGLLDPKGYLERLREFSPRSPDGALPYLVVEKILEHGESLPESWPVDGTTGYDFTNLLTALFVQQSSEPAFTRIYQDFTGERRSFENIVQSSKLQIIDNEMSSELHRLARAATRLARQNRRTADFTYTVLERALREIVAAFSVYRTYIDGEGTPNSVDLKYLDEAVEKAAKALPSIDATVYSFLRDLLSGALVAERGSRYRRSDVFRFAMKTQQYCGPVMAKGVEDTAFYRYNRFVALNEVGGAPDQFGISVDEFHAGNAERAANWPTAMLATSTHDTKRGEDTRARLATLSHLPGRWSEQVNAWSWLLGAQAQDAKTAPDRNDEYLLYQLLAGTWPAEFVGQEPDAEGLKDYVERLKGVLTKSMREAKVHSTWIRPDAAYEEATLAFVERALVGDASAEFLASFRPFADEIAQRGASVTFAHTVLKFTVPGMPDIYQGTELWDFSMVDPDNRRPVDFKARQAMLEAIEGDLKNRPSDVLQRLWGDWRDGQFKLALTKLLLDLRNSKPGLFQAGSYTPLRFDGARDVVGFVREAEGTRLLVVARLSSEPPAEGSVLSWPADTVKGQGRNVLTGATVDVAPGADFSAVLGSLPAAVIELA